MAIHSVREDGGHPSGWNVKLFAHISGTEEFLMQLAMEMPELVDASMIHGKEQGQTQGSGAGGFSREAHALRLSTSRKSGTASRSLPVLNLNSSMRT